jgi:hypothetical protein
MAEPTSNTELNISKQEESITFTLTNLLTFLAIMSPFLLTFFMIMLSIVHNSIVKGLLFLVGLVIIAFLTYLLKSILKERQSPLASPLCNILPFPFISKGTIGMQRVIFSSPILSTVLLGYISSYLIFPMYINNNVNNPLLIFLITLFTTNAVTELHKQCGTMGGVVLGGILGITFGILYYGMIAASGYKDLAYFSEIKSNAEGCKKPTDQKFKCVTYSRGTLAPW